MTNSQKPNYTFALTVMVVLMFLLGFITTMNNSMIAFCNKAFSRSHGCWARSDTRRRWSRA